MAELYRNTVSTLRSELERQSKDLYGIWEGGKYAAVQDISGLFYARCVDLYLKDRGLIGMVMPHSALQTGQHSKWRKGAWQAKPVGRGKNRTEGRTLAVWVWSQDPLGFGTVGAQHIFPHSCFCGVCAQNW